MSLEHDLAGWDGKSADAIQAIYNHHWQEPNFPQIIVDLVQNEACQKGATWLLKAYFDKGHRLTPDQIRAVYQSLPALIHWETRLHILQVMAFLPIAPTEQPIVETFLRQALTDTHKFVRAWAYSGFYELAKQDPTYQAEAQQRLEQAMQDEAASVKARVRKLLQVGF